MAVKNRDDLVQAIKKAEDCLEDAKREVSLDKATSRPLAKIQLKRTIEAATEALYLLSGPE